MNQTQTILTPFEDQLLMRDEDIDDLDLMIMEIGAIHPMRDVDGILRLMELA
jgi:hypothetical protein